MAYYKVTISKGTEHKGTEHKGTEHKGTNNMIRNEFIYTKVFNNYKIKTKVPIDFTIGTLEEWTKTCDAFNNGEMILSFALITIVEDFLICNNIHPFAEMNTITYLLNAHEIHD